MAENLTRAETHFRFGENWADYSALIDDEAIQLAIDGLIKLVPLHALRGCRFLDIGCGSGLHALAAIRCGAREVVALDIDKDSVATTRRVLARYAPNAEVTVKEMSVFDPEMAGLGRFDVVYSWGVLHHTGAMWKAIEVAARMVAPSGRFAVALYQKTPMCGFWRLEKRVYLQLPHLAQVGIRKIYNAARLAYMLVRGTNPVSYVREYNKRGMSFVHDAHDWLGGYPYESVHRDKTIAFMANMGFEAEHAPAERGATGFFGSGCLEFTFRHSENGL